MDTVPLIQTESSTDHSKKRTEEILDNSSVQEVVADELRTTNANSNEKPAKVQRTAGIFGVFSNLATGITSASYSVLEQAKEASKVMQKSIEDHTLLGGFNKMQNEFIQEKQAQERGPGVAPWVGSNDEEELKMQILTLSGDKRNFMRDPPAGANFDFEMVSYMPIATILLQEDPDLSKRRFELVPKHVSEVTFWRNYFYRISLIKQSSMLTADSSDFDDDISVASNLDLMDGSVVGDSDTHTEEHTVVPVFTPAPSKFRGKGSVSEAGSDRAGEDGWEQELQQTLDSYEVVGGDITENDLELEQSLGSDEQPIVSPYSLP